MCDSFKFNDTFDNFTFSESEKCLKTKTTSEFDPLVIANDSKIDADNIIKSISVDDSVFLSNCDNSIVNSEDVFGDQCEIIKQEETNNAKNVECSESELDGCDLSLWGLPNLILERYANRGIKKIFKWQSNCLTKNGKVLQDYCNLIYSAPTSAGKTLVSEILAIKNILERKKKVLFILPFVSTVREKMFYFQDILSGSGIRVDGFMGSHNAPGGFKSVQFAVCTIEKANGIINRLMEENCLSELGAVIVDEIHLLGDSGRGYLLELMLTKLQYMSNRFENVHIQIVGMSATLSNAPLIQKWLNSELYVTDFRPIPLHERCLVGNEIYDKSLNLHRQLLPMAELEMDTDNILRLCLETIESSCSILIFCPTKNWCENLAQQISLAFWKLGCTKSAYGLMLREQLSGTLIVELLEQLKRCPVGLDGVLQKTISYGVCYHHAGLTLDERDIIEAGFRNNALRVLIATSTLSSGVNLPAKRVIIRTPIFHGKPIDSLVYRQMVGRAGRMGKDTSGESILICQKSNFEIAKELFTTSLRSIESCLEESGKLNRAILEIIASGAVTTPHEVDLFTKCTLLAFTKNLNQVENSLTELVKESIDFLNRNEFIRLQTSENGSLKYIATSLGKACLSSSMPPEEALSLFGELEKARQCFVLETELHLIYIVTPYNICNQWGNLDWMLFLELWEKLASSMKRVGELVGVSEAYIINATRSKILTHTSKLYHKLQIHKRFFTALALQDLVNEVSLNDVAAKFGCTRGMLQSLQQSASTFAGMLTIFCRQLGWSSVEILISQFQDRLNFGVHRDLLDLMRLPILNGPRARALFNADITGLSSLASSSVCSVENILLKIGPFESEKERDGESEFDAQKRNKFRGVWVTGKEGLTEQQAALMLIQEARKYLQYELGLVEAKWDNVESTLQNSTKSRASVAKILQDEKESETFETCSLMESNNSLEIMLSHNSVGVVNENDKILNNSNLIGNATEEILKVRINNIQDTCANYNSTSVSDQSLFDDSFESSNCKEKSNKEVVDLGKVRSDIVECKNESFMENAFVSNFDLVYDTPEKLSGIINNSQGEAKSIIQDAVEEENVFLPFKKKRERTNFSQQSYSHSDDESDESVIERTPTKRKRCETDRKDSCVVDFSKFNIVDVCSDVHLYKTFTSELLNQITISLSLACTKMPDTKAVIGSKFISTNKLFEKHMFTFGNYKVIGISISWGNNKVYYISMENDTEVSYTSKTDTIAKLVSNKSLYIKLFDCKEQIKISSLCLNVDFLCNFEDPLVADWLIQPEDKAKSLQAMTVQYTPNLNNLARLIGDCKGTGSVGLDLESNLSARIRASVESVITWYLCDSINDILLKTNMNLKETYEMEMRTVACLAQMELNGLGIDLPALQELEDELRTQSKHIEKSAYTLAGRKFSLTSPSEVAKILGSHKSGKVLTSANKQALEKSENPISNLILHWRKLNCTLTKIVYPVMRLVQNNRINGCCVTRTSTGRISMHEPNLQNVPKNFEIESFHVPTNKLIISCRSSFVASKHNVFLSADYCQLELRILAHFSKDVILSSIMKSDQDVFRLVAAKWKNIEESNVDNSQRQWAKQLCYGIIYGMGTKSLSNQMLISESEAEEFVKTFHSKYPNIKRYIDITIKKCRDLGYVETLANRRRYLPNINNQNGTVRSQAERQAVNTTIQGSAADIAKKAMISVDDRFKIKFRQSKNLPKLVLHLHDELLYEVQQKFLIKTAKILKNSMEEATKLSIPLPVKLKSGLSWGAMQDLIL